MSESKKFGLIAGSDELPLIFAREAVKMGENVIAIAIEDYTSPEIEKVVKTYWVQGGEFRKIIEILKSEKIQRAVMQGKIPQSIIFSDLRFDNMAETILKEASNRQTQALLGAIANELEKYGITLLDARTYLTPVIAVEGTLTEREPDEREWKDINFGKKVLEVTGSLDIGQSVVIKNQAILALEAIEGTDSAIKRGAILGKGKVTVVKMAKPNQDMRFDLPVIGLKTIEMMAGCGATVLAIEAGKTVILNGEEVINKANSAGISVVAI